MLLRLVLVDLVDRCANSVAIQPVDSWVSAYLWVYLILRPLAYRFLNANEDCMRPCLVKLQPSLLSEFQIV